MAQNTEVATDRPVNRQMESDQSENRQVASASSVDVERPDGGRQLQGSGQQDGRQVASREDTRAMLPRCDVLEDSQGITVLADLPGVPRDMLELKIDGDTLLIEGAVSAAMPQQMEPAYVEVRVPRFRRAFTLSRELDTGKIEANLADGVLKLRIPTKAHAQPRKIAVQAS